MKSDYLEFLKVLCALYDGENYVLESEIRKKWPDCPSGNAILNLGKGVYFEYNYDLHSPGYYPTALGLALVGESEHSAEMSTLFRQLNERLDAEQQARLDADKVNARFQWANLILVILTLIVTIIFGLHSCTATPTNAEQEPEFAVTDSVQAEQS